VGGFVRFLAGFVGVVAVSNKAKKINPSMGLIGLFMSVFVFDVCFLCDFVKLRGV
jgi:FtsH-binding integral membrane protein